MAQEVIYRSDQVGLGVSIAGLSLPNQPWDVLEGAEGTVEGSLVVHPGGQLPQRALGGIAARGPATIKKLWSAAWLNAFKEVEAVRGSGLITITYTVKATAASPAAFSIVYTGVVGEVARPNYEAGKTEAAYLTVHADLDGEAQ